MTTAAHPLFSIVRLIDLQTPGESGFALLVAPFGLADIPIELKAELEAQTDRQLAIIDAQEMTHAELISGVRGIKDQVVLLTGLGHWDTDQFRALDLNRSRLDTGSFLIFEFEPSDAARFLANAPNLRSWIARHVFTVAKDPSAMTDQEVEDRLLELRRNYDLSDEAVIEQAQRGTLPPEPQFAEWLILLRRGDLVP